VSNSINTSAIGNQSRYIASTVLAVMLRYATFIQPPPIRLREEHIIPSIVSVLKENGKIENKLKKRLTAAIGESIFYISAQEEDSNENGDTVDKWVINSNAIDIVLTCLKDETDEVVRHYAAKVIIIFLLY